MVEVYHEHYLFVKMQGNADGTAVFGCGSFWEAEDLFTRLHGVLETEVGYGGGTTADPTFHDIGDHSEVVHIMFNPQQLSYDELLDAFWKLHDPTVTDDTRYDSLILYTTEEQRQHAEASIVKWQEHSDQHASTKLEPLGRFYPAEGYHQHYLAKLRGEQ